MDAEQTSRKGKASGKEISITDLWQCPVVNERDAARMLGLPISSWALLKRTESIPLFGILKRNFLLTGDLIKWLEHRRETWTPRPPKRRPAEKLKAQAQFFADLRAGRKPRVAEAELLCDGMVHASAFALMRQDGVPVQTDPDGLRWVSGPELLRWLDGLDQRNRQLMAGQKLNGTKSPGPN